MTKTVLIENQNAKELTPRQTDNDTPVETSEKEIKTDSLTETELAKIRENINKMIDAMNQKSSLLFHIATFWGQLPWWSKIIIGVVLTAPTLVLGILTQMVALLVISAVTLVCFVGFSLLMDDLDNDFNKPVDGLKSGVNNLADMLGTVINALGKIREQLSTEVSNFRLENEKLADNVDTLHQEIEAVGIQGKHIKETADKMESTANTLCNTTTSLGDMVQVLQVSTMELLEKKKMELMKTTQNLSDKVNELHIVKSEMSQQIENLNNLNDVLSGTITMMSQIAKKSLANEEQQEIFQKKLNNFLNNKEETFTQIALEFGQTGKELSETKDQLVRVTKQLNQTTEALQKSHERFEIQNRKFDIQNKKFESQVQELESLNQEFKSQIETLKSVSSKKQQMNVNALLTHGFYGNHHDIGVSNVSYSQQNIINETQGLVN